MQVLPFSHTYDKLNSLKKGETITTIRKNNSFHTREKVKVMQNGSFLCYAQLLTIDKIVIRTISTETLIKDTAPHATDRKEALELLNSFYRNPLHEGSIVYFYTLRKILAKEVLVKISKGGLLEDG